MMVSKKKLFGLRERSLNYYMQIADGLFTHLITFMLFTPNLHYIINIVQSQIISTFKLIIYSKSTTQGCDVFTFII